MNGEQLEFKQTDQELQIEVPDEQSILTIELQLNKKADSIQPIQIN